MSQTLDDLIAGLRAQAPDRDLSQVEPTVWRAIADGRGQRGALGGFIPLRTAAVAMSLIVGVAVGGASAAVAAAKPVETSVFAVNLHLAPSTLLGGGR